MEQRRIDAIIKKGRHRKDMGDLLQLSQSIADIGLLHPVVIRPDNILIAGERRLEACRVLGWDEIPVRVIDLDEIIRGEHDENVFRKDFTVSEAVAIAEELEPMEREAARARQLAGTPSEKFSEGDKGEALEKVASSVGMSRPTLEKAKKVVAAAKANPDKFGPVVEKMDKTGNVSGAYKELARAEKQKKRMAEATAVDSSILVGDMREVGKTIADNSVDLILTDPPYTEEFLHLFGDLSMLAARVLKPGGLCLVYSGQIHLPSIYRFLGEHLEYFWTFAIRHTGGAQRIFKAGVNTAWKPVIGYVKPPLSIYWDSFIDVVSGGREKDLHDWQQAEGEAAYFIEHLSLKNAVVLDPFCGSGTVLAAAKKLERQYIGIEINLDHARNASRRIG